MTEKTTSTNPLDIFIVGVRKGINIALLNLTPNVLMAFVFAHMLTLLGVMDFLGQHCGPFMALFGLPGQAITVLLRLAVGFSRRRHGSESACSRCS